MSKKHLPLVITRITYKSSLFSNISTHVRNDAADCLQTLFLWIDLRHRNASLKLQKVKIRMYVYKKTCLYLVTCNYKKIRFIYQHREKAETPTISDTVHILYV